MGKTVKHQYKIEGMHCTSCALSIDMELEDLEGVKSSNTSYAKQVVEVEVDEGVSREKIIETIKKLGYTLSPVVD